MVMDDEFAPYLIASLVLLAGAWWYARSNSDSVIEPDILSADLPSDDVGASDGNYFTLSDETMKTASPTWQPPASAAPYLSAIRAAESRYSLPDNLLARLLYQESHYRADIISGAVKSPVGAIGIAQFMPATAKDFGINPLNTDQSIDAAGRYLQQLYNRFGSWDQALAAYNWGQGNVSRKGLAAAPAETTSYFTQILSDIGLA